MKSIKVSILGADGYTCQIPRIKEGMQSLGHILSEKSPDLIYANDPTGYNKAMVLKKKFPNSYLMLNFLDVPWHLPNVDKQTKLLVEHFLAKADAVTVISFKVKKDLAKFLDRKIEVIYNPIKDVFHDKSIKKNNTFLYVGRANDPIKRIDLVKESLLKIKNAIKEIKDIEVVLTKDEGCSTYNLPPDRMGDIICMSSEFMTIGSSEDKHNLSGLNEPLRSHGGLHEREVPFISNLKLQNLDTSKQLYNYDAFYYAINGAL